MKLVLKFGLKELEKLGFQKIILQFFHVTFQDIFLNSYDRDRDIETIYGSIAQCVILSRHDNTYCFSGAGIGYKEGWQPKSRRYQ